jgi:hypothetical protein
LAGDLLIARPAWLFCFSVYSLQRPITSICAKAFSPETAAAFAIDFQRLTKSDLRCGKDAA